ncbi:Cytochrome c oxidase assembly protein COX19 [Smittium culicis]|uniref:Cytochrome c oxidase assembly protein COX19 n=1 Tax=Smittium culicis TaxID=133412 RepID=A0A1R1YQ73_9FUNG|nr:Cytochrome c oxidase assembly protein COX19 [Smittium culicis]
MSFGGPMNSSFNPIPPDRGSFPLDHDGDCKDYMLRYMECIKGTSEHSKCRELSKAYLECRMKNGLMDKTDFKQLGFIDDNVSKGDSGTKEPKAR